MTETVPENWVTFPVPALPEYEIQVDLNAAPECAACDKVRHRRKAYSGDAVQPWQRGAPHAPGRMERKAKPSATWRWIKGLTIAAAFWIVFLGLSP